MATEADFDYQGDGSAQDILKWAIDKYYPRIGLACSFQTTVLVNMVLEINRDVPIFALDTGRLNEETYACANDVERRFGIRIRWYFPRHEPVQKLVREKGLYSFRESVDNRRECCHIRKVEPLSRALSNYDCWITGLRRDQSVSRSEIKPIAIDHSHGDMVKVSPIVDWTTSDVDAYVKQHKLPYNRLMERGYKSVGCAPCTRAVHDGEHPRAGRWWWELDEHKECGLHVRNWNI
jgi:phosphoadenosine phosphosulfate reductase